MGIIKSMTGFGKANFESRGRKNSLEIKSLNSKQLDINIRLTNSFKAKEMEIRSLIAEKLERGKIDLSLVIENNPDTSNYNINKDLARKYFNELKSLSEEFNIKEADFLQLILRMPDVLCSANEEIDEDEWNKLNNAVNTALTELNNFRLHEGEILEKDFIKRIKIILELLEKVKDTDKARIDNIKLRIKSGLKEYLTEDNIDENRFEQELIYYIERLDITEETIRLKKHCDFFMETLKEVSAGKKLNFITQEIGREINTIGSKANDAQMQKFVVQMKDELEKIKEQLMNIL